METYPQIRYIIDPAAERGFRKESGEAKTKPEGVEGRFANELSETTLQSSPVRETKNLLGTGLIDDPRGSLNWRVCTRKGRK